MPIFKYRVRDRSGRLINGTIESNSLEMAGDQLYRLGYLPVEIEEAKERTLPTIPNIFTHMKKINLEDLVLFSQQLSTLYKAGLPILSSLKSIKDQMDNKKFTEILEKVCRDIEVGSTLHGAMSKHPQAFPSIFVNMVRAGETSGRLGEILDRFVSLGERELRTRQRLKEAMRYPKIVVISILIAFVILISFVIPRFASTFQQFNTPLPFPTRIMIMINKIFHSYWYVALIVIVVLGFIFKRISREEKWKIFWDRLKIRIPILGPLFIKIALTRFSYTFGILNRSGIPILQSIEITAKTLNNVILAQSVEEIGQKVKEGSTLSEAVRESGLFPPLIIQMISVGETTGALDEMLMRVTEYYDVEIDNALKKLPTYLEPALTLILGIFVLFLALAVFLPWWNLASLFR